MNTPQAALVKERRQLSSTVVIAFTNEQFLDFVSRVYYLYQNAWDALFSSTMRICDHYGLPGTPERPE